MAQDLTDKQLPYSGNFAITTTLLAITPPRGARKITLKTSVAAYLQFGVGADGDAVTSAQTYPLAADTDYTISLEADENRQIPQPVVLVAAQSGTGTVYTLSEG